MDKGRNRDELVCFEDILDSINRIEYYVCDLSEREFESILRNKMQLFEE